MKNKQFNNFKHLTVIIILLSAAISVTARRNFNFSLPTSRGLEAVELLKQNKQYDSLRNVFSKARQADGQTGSQLSPVSFAQTAKLTATDGDYFGFSVAVSGNTAIIGAPFSKVGSHILQGAAYVFVRSGATWTLQQKLTAADGDNVDYFGAVAIDGDTVVVGAYGDNAGSGNFQGAAYIFTRSGATWTQQQRLAASDGATEDFFGRSVAIYGGTIVISADSDDIGTTNQGSAYVFVRSGAMWTQQQKLTASDGATNDFFGTSVFIYDNTIIIGASNKAVGSNTGQGAAYVFTRSGTNWTQQQKLTAADGAKDSRFGNSVAISGETAIVGAVIDNAASGSAYIFTRSGTSWTQQQKLTASDSGSSDYFGNSVAISGDTVIVGADSKTVGSNVRQGAAYIFTRSGATWTQQQRLAASDGVQSEYFGSSVAVSGNTVIVGANQGTSNGQIEKGTAYIFSAPANLPAAFDFDGNRRSDLSVFRPSNAVWYSQRSSSGFSADGWGLATDKLTPADYDGDGKTDLTVWREDASNPDLSYFYIFQSSTNTLRIAQFGRIGDNPYFSGDWDGDGKADPTVFRDTGSGQTYFYYAPSTQPSVKFVSVQWGITGDKPVRGDFDGDGNQDAAVFRPSNGVWYVSQSSNNQFKADGWGTAGDKLIAADYDGDGKTDLAVLRNAVWYIKQSSDSQNKIVNWGIASDTAVPADYDGDGKTDVAVYRNGAWYIIQSSNLQVRIDNFGAADDLPIPAAK